MTTWVKSICTNSGLVYSAMKRLPYETHYGTVTSRKEHWGANISMPHFLTMDKNGEVRCFPIYLLVTPLHLYS